MGKSRPPQFSQAFQAISAAIAPLYDPQAELPSITAGLYSFLSIAAVSGTVVTDQETSITVPWFDRTAKEILGWLPARAPEKQAKALQIVAAIFAFVGESDRLRTVVKVEDAETDEDDEGESSEPDYSKVFVALGIEAPLDIINRVDTLTPSSGVSA